MPYKIEKHLQTAMKFKASDLHLIVGVPPVIRVSGEIMLIPGDALKAQDIKNLLQELMTPEQEQKLYKEYQLCFSVNIEEYGLFRMNLYFHRGNLEAAIRIGQQTVPAYYDLGLTEAVMDLTRKANGLILITGPTGMGKTTTLNCMIDFVNTERRCKVITIEDPIEYRHQNKRSIIVQQEIHLDAPSFSKALVHVLRQDPDVICIGELVDLETMWTALTAAETGHLVLGTLHTRDAVQTVTRVIDLFPPEHQHQIRMQFAHVLQGVVSQKLLPTADHEGRILALEVLIANDAVRSCIRENKLSQMENIIVTGKRLGMQGFDSLLKKYYQEGIITYETALSHIKNPRALQKEGG